MPDNKWYAGLAFGLVAGLTIAALLFAWLSDGLPGWWKHEGAVVTSTDTLANWLISVFSFIAATFLWLTLRATQEMAKDARRIGEAQVRAYLDVKLTQVQAGQLGKSLWVFRVNVHNRGQSPATQIYVHVRVGEWESWDVIFPDLGAGDQFEGGIQLTYLPDETFTRPKMEANKALVGKPFDACITIRFLDVFSENFAERFDRREFSIVRTGEESDAFRIHFNGDIETTFKRLKHKAKN